MEDFDKFALHLRDEWIPSTTNNLERYYGHTKPTLDPRRFRSLEHARSFLQTQMRVRTMKHGFVSREWSLRLGRELFPSLEEEQATALSQRRSSDSYGSVTSRKGRVGKDALAAPSERQRWGGAIFSEEKRLNRWVRRRIQPSI